MTSSFLHLISDKLSVFSFFSIFLDNNNTTAHSPCCQSFCRSFLLFIPENAAPDWFSFCLFSFGSKRKPTPLANNYVKVNKQIERPNNRQNPPALQCHIRYDKYIIQSTKGAVATDKMQQPLSHSSSSSCVIVFLVTGCTKYGAICTIGSSTNARFAKSGCGITKSLSHKTRSS